jgi:hypothetical protein
MSDLTLAQMVDEAQRLSALLEAGLKALREAADEYARAENAYREKRAGLYLRSNGTVGEREAYVDSYTGGERLRRDVADGMRSAALEAVRSRRQQLSALQSLLAAHRSEAEYVRTAGRD